VKRDSHIYKLNPVLDDGVLRVGEQLSNAVMSKESKCGIKGYRLRLRPRQFADYATMGLAPKELSIWFNQALKFVDG